VLLKIDIHEEGDTLRIVLSGEFDTAGVQMFHAGIEEASNAWRRVAIDLSDVVFMDSTGLQALFVLDEQARESGREMVLIRPSPSVMRLLELTGLEARFAVRD
jgi:anti-anti-sigma factor